MPRLPKAGVTFGEHDKGTARSICAVPAFSHFSGTPEGRAVALIGQLRAAAGPFPCDAKHRHPVGMRDDAPAPPTLAQVHEHVDGVFFLLVQSLQPLRCAADRGAGTSVVP